MEPATRLTARDARNCKTCGGEFGLGSYQETSGGRRYAHVCKQCGGPDVIWDNRGNLVKDNVEPWVYSEYANRLAGQTLCGVNARWEREQRAGREMQDVIGQNGLAVLDNLCHAIRNQHNHFTRSH